MTITIGTLVIGGLRTGPQGPPGPPGEAAAHAATHATGGGDELTPAAIGAAAADDPRLTDARTPTPHAASHLTGGSDAIQTATAAQPGLMSAAYAAKLDSIATGATAGPSLASTTPAAVGTAAVGVGTTAARADHVHAHGSQPGGSLHSAATTSAAGFMSASDKAKLDALYGHRHVTSDVTLAATDRVVTVDASGGNRTLTLPSPASLPAGCPILVKKVSTGTNTISLARSGSEQIEGAAATYALPGSDGTGRPAWTVWHDGTNWWIA